MRDKKKKNRKKGAQKKGGENSPVSPPLDPRLDTVLKTGQQGVVAEEDHCQKAQRRKRRYDKGIQTDHFEPSYAGGTVHGLKEGSLLTSKCNYRFRGVYLVASYPRFEEAKHDFLTLLVF